MSKGQKIVFMKNWQKVDQENIWHPFGPLQGQENIYIKKAKGAYLYGKKGRKILDMVSSWWVNIHGHGNRQVAKAIARQARKMEQVIFAGFTHKPALQLSENLLSILPSDQSKIFFSDDGSTSTEVAIKLSLQYWHNLGVPRRKVIAIEGAYHGDTFGAMSVGDRSIFTEPFAKHLFDVEFIPFPEGNGNNAIAAMESLVSDEVASFIFEPLVQGAGGMRMYSPMVLDKLIEIARSKDIICIADEVMTGFGRTGKLFASDHLTHKPDIFCLSKGLTGGFLPMGITTVNKKVVAIFDNGEREKTFFHGHSYTANPIACAAANASFKVLLDEKTQDAIKMIHENHRSFVDKVISYSVVDEVRLTGTILAIELKASDGGYTSSLRNQVYEFFLNRDILMRPLGNVMYLIPPYVIEEAELRMVYDHIEEFLKTLEAGTT